jgi:hypothetical protein
MIQMTIINPSKEKRKKLFRDILEVSAIFCFLFLISFAG